MHFSFNEGWVELHVADALIRLEKEGIPVIEDSWRKSLAYKILDSVIFLIYNAPRE